MRQWVTTAAATACVAATALGSPACVHADPPPPLQVAPRVDESCNPGFTGAMAVLGDGSTRVVCTDGKWVVATTPYPLSDRWLSYGPELRLHGQGMRNPEILSGRWTGYPQGADAVCTAEQVAVLGPGRLSAPDSAVGKPGEPLEFDVSPTLFDIRFTGPCLWQKV